MKLCQMRLWGFTKKQALGELLTGSLYVAAMGALLWGPGYIAPLFMK